MPSIDTIDCLVFDWLIRSGYQSTFNRLPAPLYAQSQAKLSFLPFRAEISKLIKNGRIQEAVDLIEKEFKGVLLEMNKKSSEISVDCFKNIPKSGSIDLFTCLFLLKLQNFIELIRQRDTPVALNYVQGHLLPFCQSNSSFEAVLQDTLGVLVYAHPEISSMDWCFEKSRRYSALASLVNYSLYNFSTKMSSAPLESLLKHVHGVDTLIIELNGFGNDLDDRKWSSIQSLLNNELNVKKLKFIKTIKNE